MNRLKKGILSELICLLIGCQCFGASVKGCVIDKATKEPLIGATVQFAETSIGATTDFDGNYEIVSVEAGTYELLVQYVSYKTIHTEKVIVNNKDLVFNFEMEVDDKLLSEVVITGRKDLESEMALLNARQASTITVENIGAKEMSRKGISNVADGMKKLTGISLAESNQLIVRGLGDRYSLTALNGLPIASPNPDNKLIPLDLFQSSTVKNITVKKVFEVGNFADYSGAYIDIATKECIDESFFNISLNLGGRFNTTFRESYQIDNQYGLWVSNNLSDNVKNMSYKEFLQYAKSNDPFGTDFSINKKTALPDLSGSVSIGKNYNLGKNKLGIMASLSVKNENSTMKDVYKATYNTQGIVLNEYESDSYTNNLNLASLVNVGFSFRGTDNISYTLFYARNASSNYKLRQGFDDEGIQLIGSNSVTHINHLLTNQLHGTHKIANTWKLQWSGSYSTTGSSEPDRRQVMYCYNDDIIKLFSLNQQETMRYFGELDENEVVADMRIKKESVKYSLQFGGTYKTKQRDYTSTRFYYNTNKLNPIINSIDDIFNPNSYLNQENVANGSISIIKDHQPRFDYYAGSDIFAGFAEMNYNLTTRFLINAGVRFEQANQWVRYWNDASIEKIARINSTDFFPALNLKYNINETNDLKLSISKTVTRPGFIEMAPFLYKESFGSDEIRGNEDLTNGYNYNFDLHYDLFSKDKSEMFSVTAYFKLLKNPIERVQELAGGSAVNTFLNADQGMASGLEFDIRKKLSKNFKAGFNASLIYTDVILPENGVYTDYNRSLQGASPYLLNADLTYSLKINEKQKAQLTLLYNLQGPRIHTVGINGMENVIQKAVNTLDFIANYNIGERWSIKLKMSDLLNTEISYTQKIKATGETVDVEHYKPGTRIEFGVTCKFF